MKNRVYSPHQLPATTAPLPAISTDTNGQLYTLSTAQLRAVDLGQAQARATDGDRWSVWGAARSGARTMVTTTQKRVLIGIALVGALAFALAPHATLVWLLFIVTLLYVLAGAYKCSMIVRGAQATEYGMGASPDVSEIADEDLPIYSVLVPLHREGAILPILLDHLSKLDYPQDKLEVLLLIETDDTETRDVLDTYNLPSHMRPITVPPGMPKTKPRALNVGLARATGEFIVVYDAEDQPEPDQLRKAVGAFRQSDWNVVCYQARLSFFNARQSILTRLFTLDYYVWYGLLLQGLARTGAFVPLGGTSNHFRTATMRRLGGWDPYNVTEDGDLGVRISRAGLEVRTLDSVTWEEAVAQALPWVRQRSRWIKGYMQTFLVHMRDPRTLWRQLGPSGFLDFQTLLGGSSLLMLINPLMWLLTLVYIVGHGTIVGPAIQSLFPPAVYYPSLLCLVVGNFVFFYTNIYACVRGGYYDLARYMLLSPLYWVLMSIAAWVALISLIRNPFYWAKTTHGTSLAHTHLRTRAQMIAARAPEYALSIIIPAFNEEQRLPTSLHQLHERLGDELVAEVVVVDDGSDDATCEVVRQHMAEWPALRLVERPHAGKGAAIRSGILAAEGEYILLADADFSMSADQIERFSATTLGDYDVAIGVREGEEAQRIGEPVSRRIMSRTFNLFVRLALLPGFRDTQCGFKCLRLDVARDLALSQTREGWGFDVELLFIARKRGYVVREVPIVWQYVAGSRIHPLRDALMMVGDILRVRWNNLRGIYADHTLSSAAPERRSIMPETRISEFGVETLETGIAEHAM